jgi:hypothetical protein
MRTVKISTEIKQTSEWTMNKVAKNVLEEKKRKRREEIKEQERVREEQELRHQLETQSVVTSLSKWLIQKGSQVISNNPSHLSSLKSLKRLTK